MPSPKSIPSLGDRNRVLDPGICPANATITLRASSFARAANNPWGLPIGWTEAVGCPGPGGPHGCPYLTVWNGTRYVVDNNVLPGCEREVTSPPYVTDLYPLDLTPDTTGGVIRLQVAELEADLTFLDEVKLFATDLPDTVSIGTKEDGSVVFYRAVRKPAVAVDPDGVSWRPELRGREGASVPSDSAAEVTATFAVGSALAGGGCVVTARQKEVHHAERNEDNKAPKWDASLGKTQADAFGLRGGIEVALLDTALAGGLSVTDTLHPRDGWTDHHLDLASYLSTARDSVLIRLRWLGSHRVDRVVVSQAAATPALDTLALLSATHPVVGDARALIGSADPFVAVLNTGDSLDLRFQAPASAPSGTRRYLLLAKGYYLLGAGKGNSGEQSAREAMPAAFRLRLPWPNPTRGATEIRYDLPRATRVALRIYDVSGRVVTTLLDEERPAGYYSATWDGQAHGDRRVSAGIYFARLDAGNESDTQKFVLIK